MPQTILPRPHDEADLNLLRLPRQRELRFASIRPARAAHSREGGGNRPEAGLLQV